MSATYSTRDEAIEREIIQALGEHVGDYDIEAIAGEVLGDYSQGYACQVEPEEFWRVVERHDRVQAPEVAMTDAEFRCTREALGLTAEWVADQLGVALRTVRRWESGHSPVPAGVADTLGEWVETMDDMVQERVGHDVLVIPRDGDREEWPASWWRALAARIMEQVDGLRVVYTD